jgi:hypothetical protein
MIQIRLLFLCGLTLSAIAAFYAVSGLMAIFAASAMAIAIMGTALEVSKLVVATWLYNNWSKIPRLMRTYFVSALLILLCLTSLGIFGYLSKAHLDQAVPTGDVAQQLSLIDEKIKVQRDTITNARSVIQQMDDAVNQTMTRTEDAKGAERALQIRRSQARDRSKLTTEIETAQAEIIKLNTERAPVASEVRKVEAEVGPIKYIAALIYGDELSDNLLESAVRIVILMIIFVFDPLAVLMLIAANFSLKKEKENNGNLEQNRKLDGRSARETSSIGSREIANGGNRGENYGYTIPTKRIFDFEKKTSSTKPKIKRRTTKAKDSTKKTRSIKNKNTESIKEASDSQATSETQAEQHEVVKENKQQGEWNYTVYRDKFTEKDPFSELRNKYVRPRRP